MGGIVKFSSPAVSVLGGGRSGPDADPHGRHRRQRDRQWATVDGTAIGTVTGDYFPASGP